ncbi:oligosaccharide flippase family protein [Enterococcus casseliflavus]|uniref:oligosaccharide flippase family protein n=1 Tax=Enterococcus casseliflavus TaxID=37734 RepID=UPI0039A6039C
MRKLIGNVFYQSIFQVLKIVLPVITIPIVSKALGPSGIGEYNYMNSIVSYFLLFAGLGMDMYGIREIAIVRNSKKLLSQKFWELQIFNGIISLIVILLYAGFSMLSKNPILYLIQTLILVGAFFDISWFFAGIEEFKAITISNLFIKIIGFIFIVLYVKNYSDLIVYVFIQSMTIFLSQLILWIFLFGKITLVKINFKNVIRHTKPAASFFVGKIATTLYMNINKTILGLIGTFAMVGIFSNSTNLIFIVVALVGTIDTVMLPKMSNLQSSGSEEKIIKILDTTLHIQVFFSILFMFGLISVADSLVYWFFGPEFSQAALVLKLLSPLIIIKCLGTSIVKQYLMPKNQIRNFNLSVIIGAVINALLNFSLIPVLGVFGAVFATFITESLVTGIRIYFLLKQTDFKFNIILITKQILSAATMLVALRTIFFNFDKNIYTTLLEALTGFAIYMFLTYVLKVNLIYSFITTNMLRKRN